MLEKMDTFFDSRLDGYETHQLTCIEGAEAFYPFTAGCLPLTRDASILDLGCGTGLELDCFFRANPTAKITGIDLAPGMLAFFEKKFENRDITVIKGSYFDVPFGKNIYEAAVSVESLHHYTKGEKLPLYRKLYTALKDNGYFILTDYFAATDAEEAFFAQELKRLKMEQMIQDNEFCHYDTPLTVAHETKALLEAGFSSVEILNNWGATYTLKASK